MHSCSRNARRTLKNVCVGGYSVIGHPVTQVMRFAEIIIYRQFDSPDHASYKKSHKEVRPLSESWLMAFGGGFNVML